MASGTAASPEPLERQTDPTPHSHVTSLPERPRFRRLSMNARKTVYLPGSRPQPNRARKRSALRPSVCAAAIRRGEQRNRQPLPHRYIAFPAPIAHHDAAHRKEPPSRYPLAPGPNPSERNRPPTAGLPCWCRNNRSLTNAEQAFADPPPPERRGRLAAKGADRRRPMPTSDFPTPKDKAAQSLGCASAPAL